MADLKKSKRKRGWLSNRFYGKLRQSKLQLIRSRSTRIRQRKRSYRTVLVGHVPATVYRTPPILNLPDIARIPALSHLEWD